ncbi:MAG: dienelactone hydrolase family protein [Betaproteobacteria bacterium]|jgi:carboxymethylenebutenolidase|nr:dienelactone hydrolase family protein [Betaproteobacteria bacterium]
MNASWISIKNTRNEQFDAYLSLPPTGRGPGLVILQEIFGVNEHIRAVADQYAADGYCVIAPDIFWREGRKIELAYDPQGFERGLGLLGKLNIDQTAIDLQATVAALKQQPACTGKVGSLGFCMGGLLSYIAAAEAGVDTAVCYYGGGIHQHLDRAKKIRCPVLFHFADQDAYIPQQAVAAVRKSLGGRKNVRLIVHAGVDHGFNCWRRPAWNQVTAARARGQSLVHLSESLS